MHKLPTIYQIAYIPNALGYSKYSNIKLDENLSDANRELKPSNYKILYPPFNFQVLYYSKYSSTELKA